jgi:hypothetical protein
VRLPLWARAGGSGDRADGVVFRRRAVTCRIFQIMVILRQALPARDPVNPVRPASRVGCARPLLRSACLH